MKTKLLTLLVAISTINLMAATTFNYSTSVADQTIDGITVQLRIGGGKNEPAAVTNSTVRLYANNTITIQGQNIKKISLTFAKNPQKDYASMSVDVGSLSSGGTSTSATDTKTDTWTGNANTITFTIGSTGQRVLKTIVVEIGTGGTGGENNVITYTASAKLQETTRAYEGLHTNAFNVAISSHIFSNGTGTITFAGEVTSIGDYAFFWCNDLTSITIPNSVTTIGSRAFYECSGLTSITIPSSVTTIEDDAFYGCTSLPIVDNIRYADTCFLIEAVDKSLSTYTIKEGIKWIGSQAFENCSGLTSVTIPNSVTTIGESAFSGCSGLTSVTIPNSVTTIGKYAFEDCSGLTSITIPNSVTTIGESAFSGCSGLTSVTIPTSVTTIGYDIFSDCSKLTSITWNAINCEVDYSVPASPFYGITSQITSFTFGNKVQTIPYKLCYDMSKLTSITIPNSVTTIGSSAFEGCSGLTSVTIGNSVTSIVHWAFHNCSNLTSIRFECTTPPSFDSPDDFLSYAIISVPCGCALNYKDVLGESYNYSTYGDRFPYSLMVSSADDMLGTVETISNPDCITNEATIEAFATKYGYDFDHWSDGNTDNPHTITITKDTNLVAYFAKKVYIVTTYATDGQVQGNKHVEYLDTCTLTVTPNYGYHFTRWSDGNTDNPRKIEITQDTMFIAEFAKNSYSFEVKANDDTRGSVVGTNGTYEYQTELTISATARIDLGYHFAQWSDGDMQNPRALTLTKDTILVAQFEENKCGDNLMWYLKDGALQIVGTGAMYDDGFISWSSWAEKITSISLPEGLTSIGSGAFAECSNVKEITIPTTVTSIGNYAFENCTGLRTITCFATNPPLAENYVFYGVSQYTKTYVLASSLEDYQFALGWRDLNLLPIGSTETTITTDTVIIQPSITVATFTWPSNPSADGYSLVITKDGIVFCTLKFNAQGQLTGIAFAPSRGGEQRTMQAAEMTAKGWQFTVTGLDQASRYGYTLDALNAGQQSIKHYQGEFYTDGYTGLEGLTIDNAQCTVRKFIKNNQLQIMRNGKTYDAQGMRVE